MPGSKRTRVFVVDDEPIIAFTLATILESAGYTARYFSDPAQALQAAQVNCPDYLVSDVVMPDINGIDLGVQFKAIHPRVRVLLFSGVLSTALLREDARKKGQDFDVLSKPIHPHLLLTALEKLAEQGESG